MFSNLHPSIIFGIYVLVGALGILGMAFWFALKDKRHGMSDTPEQRLVEMKRENHAIEKEMAMWRRRHDSLSKSVTFLSDQLHWIAREGVFKKPLKTSVNNDPAIVHLVENINSAFELVLVTGSVQSTTLIRPLEKTEQSEEDIKSALERAADSLNYKYKGQSWFHTVGVGIKGDFKVPHLILYTAKKKYPVVESVWEGFEVEVVYYGKTSPLGGS